MIFVLDSNDKNRINEAKKELHLILKDELLKDAVVLVLANKFDLLSAMSISEITEKLELHSLGERRW